MQKLFPQLQEMELAISRSRYQDGEICQLFNIGVSEKKDARHYHFENNLRVGAVLFQYTLGGEGVFRDGKEIYVLPPGTGFLAMFPSDTAYWLEEGKTWRFIYVLLGGELVFRLAKQLLHRHGAIFPIPPDHPAIFDLTEIFTSAAQGKLANEFILSANVYRFFMQLRYWVEYPFNEIPDMIRWVREYLHQHYAEVDLHLDQLAEQYGYSPRHIARLFKRYFHQSPYSYLIQIRLRKAYDLLLSTDMPIKQIVFQTGFKDYAHFCTMFRKYFGISAGMTRKQQRRFGNPLPVKPGDCVC